jgi:hypothetical protein
VVSRGQGIKEITVMEEETVALILKIRWTTFSLLLSVTSKITIVIVKEAAEVATLVLLLLLIARFNQEAAVVDNPLKVATTITESE